MTRPKEFAQYIQRSKEYYSRIKTFLSLNRMILFSDMYVCNTLGLEEETEQIEDATLEKILVISRHAMIIGSGGIGKSMMMRHLFLDSVEKSIQTGKIPIFVSLKDFGEVKSELLELIVASVQRFDFHIDKDRIYQLLEESRCQVLFDGMDEIKHQYFGEFQRQIDILDGMFPSTQFIISTREIGKFINMRFVPLRIRYFSEEQARNFIEKNKFYLEDPGKSEEFSDLIFEKEKLPFEISRNPLFLTILAI